MTFSENDDVITEDGRHGTVRYVRGDTVRVLFPDGSHKPFRASKLRHAPKGRSPVPTPAARSRELEASRASAKLIADGLVMRASELPVTRSVPKVKPLRSRAYLEYVRSHPCCRCGARDGIQASHHGAHGIATKPDDYLAVPLCSRCHLEEFHQHGTFRGLSRAETDEVVTRVAIDLLLPWLLDRSLHAETLRALVAALRERSAA